MPYPSMWPQYQLPPWQQWAPQASSSSSWASNWHGPSPSGKFTQSISQQQLNFLSSMTPNNLPVHPQLPIQPNLNPNNKGAQ